MKKPIFVALFLLSGLIFAANYEIKEAPDNYKEPSDSKFIRISALEVKVVDLESRIKDLEEKVRKLTNAP